MELEPKELTESPTSGSGDLARDLAALQHELRQANLAHNDIFVDHPIRFKTPVVGQVWAAFRSRIHREVRTYLDAMITRQVKFNSHAVRTLNNLTSLLENWINSTNEIHRSVEEVRESVDGIVRSVEEVRESVDGIVRSVDGKSFDQISYFSFEDRFRGSPEDVRVRQEYYAQFFLPGDSVLDIGCGRGEFLQLLRQNGIGCYGVDVDDDMINFCRRHRLDVRKEDALEHLRSLPDKCLDGIFAGQVVEHLHPSELVELLKLCYAKLKFGSFLVVETVNALSLSTVAISFHLDPTHRIPVHPETLRFLLQSCGFEPIDLHFSSPVPEEAQLKMVVTDGVSNEATKSILEKINRNFEHLNRLLYGYQDYAAIARK